MGGYGGGMYGGVGGVGGGMMGPNGEMQGPPGQEGMVNSFAQSTQATFQIIESLVGAFGGMAQMLESTYMATHSSFFGTFCHILSPPIPAFTLPSRLFLGVVLLRKEAEIGEERWRQS